MAVLVQNNAYSTLASGINNVATTITLATGTGSRFPTITGSDYFFATLINTSNQLEIVKVTARSTDTLTVVRGQDNTTARAYSTGDRIEMRVTAGLLAAVRDSVAPADGGVTTAKLADSAVTTAKIADSAVTLAKIAAAVQQLLIPTGAIQAYAGSAAPTGWLLCSGGTIGSASSGGSLRANADTQTLFELLWNTFGNTQLPIYTSAGVVSTRGANATTDFTANKRLAIPDLRGRVIAGFDSMGGSSADRLTNQSGGLDGDILGASGGVETHILSEAQLPAHKHLMFADTNPSDGSPTISNIQQATRGNSTGGSGSYVMNGTTLAATLGLTASAGSGTAHNNVQPTIVMNYIIKL